MMFWHLPTQLLNMRASVLLFLVLTTPMLSARISVETTVRDVISLKQHQLPFAASVQSEDQASILLPSIHANQSWKKSSHVTASNGLEIIKFSHAYAGVPVYGDWAILIFDTKGRAAELSYNMTALSQQGVLDLKVSDRSWHQSKQQAINQFKAQHSGAILHGKAEPYWFQQQQTLIPAYKTYVITVEQGRPVMHAHFLNAEDGSVLARYPITHEATYGYRVYADEDGYPLPDVYGMNQPHPDQKPSGFFPGTTISQNMLFVDEFAETSDDPWLDDNATETAGNNVDVFFNSLLLPGGFYDNSFEGGAYGPGFQPQDGDFRAQLNGDSFDYVYNPSLSANDFYQFWNDANPRNPSPTNTQINAKLVQGFYMANFMRDMFYDAGFTEAAGNAQQNNFGRGGIGNDRMIIHGNCNSTFIFTPGDGTQPVMCLGLNTSSGSRQDAGLELSLFAHEWGHYLYRRLVNGPIEEAQTQSRSLNEGVADFLGVFMNVREEHMMEQFTTVIQEGIVGLSSKAFTSSYSVGSYFNVDYIYQPFFDQGGTEPDPYFYGIRRWPYGPSNPLTFRHVEHNQKVPDGFPFFDWKGRSKFNAEYHSAGEIWAAALWDCYRNILYNRTDRDFVENRKAMASYLVAGLQATPPNPNFTEGRDALLKAMRLSDEVDWRMCRQVMVNRGMGSGAIAPSKDSRGHSDVVESFKNDDLFLSIVNIQTDDSITSLDTDGVLDAGETGFLTLTIKNTGFDGISEGTLILQASPDYVGVDGATAALTALQPGEEMDVRIPLTLQHTRHYDETEFLFEANLSGEDVLNNHMMYVNHRTHYDVVNSNQTETFDYAEQLSAWSQDDIRTHPYTDTAWEYTQDKAQRLMQIAETYAGFQVALVSPWLRRESAEIRLLFEHSFDFTEGSNQFGFVEYSVDEIEWSRVENTSGGEILYSNTSANYPLLEGQFLAVPVPTNSDFKIRFRISASDTFEPQQPVDWRLDNVRVAGIGNQPFMRVIEQRAIP